MPNPTDNYENKNALVTGWGKLNFKGQASRILRVVNVTTMTNIECQELPRVSYSRITDNMICAEAFGNGGPCKGDSGGALAFEEEDGKYTQIGIVSWGYGCDQPGQLDVYTRVNTLLSWVKQHVQGICLSIAFSKPR